MNFRHLVLALAPLTIAACVSRSESLQSLVGQPISGVIAHAGVPDREMTQADGTRIVQYTETTTRMRFAGQTAERMCPDDYTTTGTVARQPFALTPTYNYSATTKRSGVCYISGFSQTRVPVQSTCTDVFAADPAGIIRSVNSYGDC